MRSGSPLVRASPALLLLAACGSSAVHPAGPKLEHGTQRVAVPGGEVVIDVRGQGPLCFAHPGGPGLDSGYLHGAALEKHFTVVYIDPIGTGSSSKLPEPELYSIGRDVEVVEALRAKLGIDKLCLIGHSYGGFVALSYAVSYPTKLRGLFLYSTSPTTNEEWTKQMMANTAWFKDQTWFADAMQAFATQDAADQKAIESVLQRQSKLYFADYSGRRADYDPLIARFQFSADVARRRPQGKQGNYDVRGKFGRLGTTPTLIVTGDKDFMTGPVPSHWIQQSIANSHLVVIEHAGHFAHVEQPAAFEAAVEQFIDQLR
jgi:proline iminopeptidase